MPSHEPPLVGQSILVVEDTYWVAADVKRTLNRAGAGVVGPVAYIQQALDALDSAPTDAAVLDVNLDGALSYPVASELERRSIPYLFATGYEPWAMPEKWRAIGRIEKPFSEDALVDALGQLLPEASRPDQGEGK